eukprot:5899942-Pyramimonas_sp.AAC.1
MLFRQGHRAAPWLLRPRAAGETTTEQAKAGRAKAQKEAASMSPEKSVDAAFQRRDFHQRKSGQFPNQWHENERPRGARHGSAEPGRLEEVRSLRADADLCFGRARRGCSAIHREGQRRARLQSLPGAQIIDEFPTQRGKSCERQRGAGPRRAHGACSGEAAFR